MFKLLFRESFYNDLKRIRDTVLVRRIKDKVLELENHGLGKKLAGNPYWSLRVGDCRIIYLLEGETIEVIKILKRKYGYREL